MELFRGYVPTRNKQCLEKFKGVEKLKTRSEVQDLDEYAGILGEETILIDVDDAETSELLFRIVQDLELILHCKQLPSPFQHRVFQTDHQAMWAGDCG